MLPVLFILSLAAADPVDTAYLVLDAIQWQDGYRLEDLLSEDLYLTVVQFLDQARDLAEADPVLAENMLNQRYNGRITVEDITNMNNQDLIGKLLGEVNLPSADGVERESANLQGRNAAVVLFWPGGGSVSFQMVWENSDWHVTDSSILHGLFN